MLFGGKVKLPTKFEGQRNKSCADTTGWVDWFKCGLLSKLYNRYRG